MKVYIEYVLIDNLIFNYLIISLALKVKGIGSEKLRKITSSFIGAVTALFMPILKIHQIYLLIIKLTLSIVMVFIGGKYKTFKMFLKVLNLFYLFTFVFGGFIYGISYLINIDYSFLYGTTGCVIPLGIFIVAGVILYKCLVKLYLKIFEKKIIYPFIRECELLSKGQIIRVNALIDSGNHLIYNGENPISVAGKELAKSMMLSGFLNDSFVGNMDVSTVNGHGKIKIYKIDELRIYSENNMNIIKGVNLGIPEKEGYISDEYQLILSANFALKGEL